MLPFEITYRSFLVKLFLYILIKIIQLIQIFLVKYKYANLLHYY